MYSAEILNVPTDNVIFAFTMSPDEIISKFEHKTASLDSRISCIELALDKWVKTRIAFDPMIYCKNWKSVYTDMFDKITGRILTVSGISATDFSTYICEKKLL